MMLGITIVDVRFFTSGSAWGVQTVTVPTGDMTLSPSGPIIAMPERGALSKAGNAPRGQNTYTYLRCWYRISNDPLKPDATYEWARNPSDGDWYRVPGFWWVDGVMQWKNMFYSETAQSTLMDVCRKTLEAQGIHQDLTQVVAANNQYSLNYTIWTIDHARQDASINKLIVFGDSLSDTQNMFNASQWRLPNRTSWHAGRFSDGLVWTDYLAKSLELPMYNWAVGGSATDQYLIVPGLLQQVESWREYMERAPNYRAENTLFLVFGGGNDIVNYGRSPEQAASAVRDSLDLLVARGAKRILLVTLPDVSRAPVFAFRSDAANVSAQVKDYNRRLVDVAARLRNRHGATLRLELFDAYALFNDLLERPAHYGFDDAARSCLTVGASSSLTYISAQMPRDDCQNPARFVFWDALHPSTHTHEWMAHFIEMAIRQHDWR
ncbi:SGNH/GDSL hydrolase family protein [Burkholderia territorii]|nr:SGNH/GDSL hydrolase family protein [Burkholderia territorii]